MRDVGAEVPANDDVPCWVMLLVELLLYVRGYILLDVVFGECLGRNVHRVLLHLLGHVRVLYHGLPLFGHLWFGALSTPCSDAQSSFAMLGCVLGCRVAGPRRRRARGRGSEEKLRKKKYLTDVGVGKSRMAYVLLPGCRQRLSGVGWAHYRRV